MLLFGSSFSYAQNVASDKPSLKAERVVSDSEIRIDGLLDELIWAAASTATDFVQNFPSDGGKPSQRTEVKVLYSNQYLYVGAYNYDSAPDSIAATLFRRDGDELSDWIFVSIDSYDDNLTAFTFGVNPVGVQKDIMQFNDIEEDVLWDAVWEAETSINSDGWIAEFRIPLSQLRFTSSKNVQNWGINFERQIARHEEYNYWSRVPREEYGEVSWYGTLEGVMDLSRPIRLEALPYISAELTREPDLDNSDPFFEENDLGYKIGGDFKYGITSDFTLTGTINPDFGQVEADPATINLTNFEIFFDEQRPFFLEGGDIFSYGNTASQNTFSTHSNFYSRRIGKSPTGDVFLAGITADFEDRPQETTIAGAVKVSGKTDKGLSIGFLDAYTLEENASFFFSGDSTRGNFQVEPATNFMVARIEQDLKGGDLQIGGFASAVNRSLGGSYLQDYLHKSAYQVGLDGQYFWANRSWGASGVLAASQVNGTQNALLFTQTTSARYYNRTDSKKLSVDPSKTSLDGYYGEFSVGKYGGAGLLYSFTYSEMSPGYEVNDIGFLERADYRAPHFYAEYLNLDSELFRFYLLWGFGGYAWNFDGDMIMNFYSSGAYFQLNNLWSIIGTAGFTGKFYNDRITRGGPVMRRPKDWNTSLELRSDQTENFYATIGNRYRKDASGEYTTTLYASLNYRPTSFIQIQFSPTYIKEKNTDQYHDFGNYDADIADEYLFSDSFLDIFYTEIRVDWTFTSKLSLQTYLRPLLYTADFQNFKYFEERKTYDFIPISTITTPDVVDSFNEDLDFNYKALQGNAVLRWEYRPGSTFFFVWQQEREGVLNNDMFDLFGGTRDIFDNEPTNVFLLKFSYWFGS
ncbi:MAG: hypothetical protein ED557_02930 [Balneola sp.]|nr:MAG: hypothetical protein ED557_02930 [Balneola sp.]